MILAGTGHRPPKLGGYSVHVEQRLLALAENALHDYTPVRVISGMALGWDMALATAALKLTIPFTAAVPFIGQESMWPAASRQRYNTLLEHCDELKVVCPGGYAASKMQVRNEWMVNNCTHLLALWDGSPGGTGNCITYANKVARPIINLWDKWV